MSRITRDLATSLDGDVAGPDQSLDEPWGEGVGDRLHRWMLDQADENADELAAITAASAFVMRRDMLSPGRGAWDRDWKGWWGDVPPYHAPT